ncbi:glycosyltransferase [Azospirillum lipoferum]|uniref:Membrane glycosyltransferase n=1 Tax=Azospirillum lipoferum (strain 4B) TaxID=862719 RepID=G7ZJ47_AZOL4|nr:glycosyltransferase [Azospirillum lipoferum]CBS91595.1 putative membrane glycosyltransferase [Azospirillum lipoferum 4B]
MEKPTLREDGQATLAIVIPVFNDWESVAMLIRGLGRSLGSDERAVHLVIVDDGSTEPEAGLKEAVAETPFTGTLLRLVRNVGHQRAIAIGLCQAVELAADRVVIMDGDGEDRPEDVPLLLAGLRDNPRSIVVADRRSRSEGPSFTLFYRVYKKVFSLLTGTPISFGNFSAMGLATATRLASMHELLLHVPATMIRSRCPIVRVGTDRGHRYAGQSKMNLVSLVVHGLSSIAVFSERTFTRILLFSAAIFALSGLAAVIAVLLKMLGMATPGWTTTVAGIVMVVLVQNAAVSLGGLFVVLNNKRDFALIPRQIAPIFLAEAIRLGGRSETQNAGSEETSELAI